MFYPSPRMISPLAVQVVNKVNKESIFSLVLGKEHPEKAPHNDEIAKQRVIRFWTAVSISYPQWAQLSNRRYHIDKTYMQPGCPPDSRNPRTTRHATRPPKFCVQPVAIIVNPNPTTRAIIRTRN